AAPTVIPSCWRRSSGVKSWFWSCRPGPAWTRWRQGRLRCSAFPAAAITASVWSAGSNGRRCRLPRARATARWMRSSAASPPAWVSACCRAAWCRAMCAAAWWPGSPSNRNWRRRRPCWCAVGMPLHIRPWRGCASCCTGARPARTRRSEFIRELLAAAAPGRPHLAGRHNKLADKSAPAKAAAVPSLGAAHLELADQPRQVFHLVADLAGRAHRLPGGAGALLGHLGDGVDVALHVRGDAGLLLGGGGDLPGHVADGADRRRDALQRGIGFAGALDALPGLAVTDRHAADRLAGLFLKVQDHRADLPGGGA